MKRYFLALFFMGLIGFTNASSNISVCQTIGSSGVYDITNNLTATLDVDCIIVDANDIQINGNGYFINGTGAEDGISIASNFNNITVDNLKTITQDGAGIDFLVDISANATNLKFINMVAGENGGIHATAGTNVLIENWTLANGTQKMDFPFMLIGVENWAIKNIYFNTSPHASGLGLVASFVESNGIVLENFSLINGGLATLYFENSNDVLIDNATIVGSGDARLAVIGLESNFSNVSIKYSKFITIVDNCQLGSPIIFSATDVDSDSINLSGILIENTEINDYCIADETSVVLTNTFATFNNVTIYSLAPTVLRVNGENLPVIVLIDLSLNESRLSVEDAGALNVRFTNLVNSTPLGRQFSATSNSTDDNFTDTTPFGGIFFAKKFTNSTIESYQYAITFDATGICPLETIYFTPSYGGSISSSFNESCTSPAPGEAFYVLTQLHPLLPNGVLTTNLTSQLIVNYASNQAFMVLTSFHPLGYSLLVNTFSNIVTITGRLQGSNWSFDSNGTLSMPQRSGTVLCNTTNGITQVNLNPHLPDATYAVLLTAHDEDNLILAPKIINKTGSSFHFILRRGSNAGLNCANFNTHVDWLVIDN